MKKLFLIALLLSAAALCRAAEKKVKDNTKLELYFDDEKTASVRVITPVSELRLASRPGKSNFGAAVTTAKLFPRLPLTFRVGNLGAGGSLSVLNSPELSSGSTPFTQTLTVPAALTATLPGSASYSKPVSAFFEARLTQSARVHNSHPALPAITCNLWLTPQTASPVGSLITVWRIPLRVPTLTLSTSFTTGLFNYESNATGSWFLKSPCYPASAHWCSLFQTGADLKTTQTTTSLNLTAALYESPFGFYQLLYRSDLRHTRKHLEFFTQFFFNPYDEVLTSSEKKLTSSFQTKGGIILKTQSKLAALYLHSPVFLKLGVNAFCRINLTETEHPIKINTGAVFTSGPVSTTATYSISGSLLSQSPKAAPSDFQHKEDTFQLKTSWQYKSFTPSLSACLTVPKTHESKKSCKLSASTGFSPASGKLPLTLNAQSAYSFTIEGTTPDATPAPTLQNKKLTASLTARLNFRRLTVTGKISADIDLYLE